MNAGGHVWFHLKYHPDYFDCYSKGGGQAANHFDGEVPSCQYQMAEMPGIKGP